MAPHSTKMNMNRLSLDRWSLDRLSLDRWSLDGGRDFLFTNETRSEGGLVIVQPAVLKKEGICLEQILGRGGQGMVYRAINEACQQLVVKQVKKVFKSDGSIHPKHQYQLLREVQILKAVGHELVMGLLGFVEDDEHWYLILEHIRGNDLLEVRKSTEFSDTELLLLSPSWRLCWRILTGWVLHTAT